MRELVLVAAATVAASLPARAQPRDGWAQHKGAVLAWPGLVRCYTFEGMADPVAGAPDWVPHREVAASLPVADEPSALSRGSLGTRHTDPSRCVLRHGLPQGLHAITVGEDRLLRHARRVSEVISPRRATGKGWNEHRVPPIALAEEDDGVGHGPPPWEGFAAAGQRPAGRSGVRCELL